MNVTLVETKEYLRIDGNDEDTTVENILNAAYNLCADISRLTEEEFDNAGDVAKIAVLYAVGYFYEHGEDANHHELTLTLRSLLFGIRREEF